MLINKTLVYLILALAVVSISCIAQADNAGMKKGVECSTTAMQDKWLGNNKESVVSELGQPISETEFYLLDTLLHEFRIGLYSLKQSLKAGENPVVQEVTWRQGDECRLTLWFAEAGGKTEVINTLLWHKDMEF